MTSHSDVSGTVLGSALKVFWESPIPGQTKMSAGSYIKWGTLELSPKLGNSTQGSGTLSEGVGSEGSQRQIT